MGQISHIAIFCGSPYQLINAINIKKKLYNNDNADLFFFSYCSNAKQIAENTKKANIFDNVYYLEANNKREALKTIVNLWLNPKCKKMHTQKEYNRLFFCYNGPIENLLFNLIYKKNKEIEIDFFDDGVASYVYPYKKALYGIYKAYIKIFFPNMLTDHISRVLLYRPEAAQTNTEFTINKLPFLDKHDVEMVNALNMIFEYDPRNNDFTNTDIIFFEEAFEMDTGKSDKGVIDFFINTINNIDLNVKLKRHPRVKINRFESSNISINKISSIPWEIYLLNHDFTNTMMVTISSTAALSPKIIFNEDPPVALLYNLLPQKGFIHTDKFEKYIQIIAKLYKDKKRFINITNKNQLNEFITQHW